MMPYSVPYYPIPQPSVAYPPASVPPGPTRAAHHVRFEPYNEYTQPGQQGPPPVPLVAPYDTWATPPGGYYGPGDSLSRSSRQPVRVRHIVGRSASPTPASSPSGLKNKRRHKTVKFEQDSDDDVLHNIDEYSPPLQSHAPSAETLSPGAGDDDSDEDRSDELRSNSTVEARAASIGGSADGEQSEDLDATPSQPSPRDDQNAEVAHILASSYTGQGYTVAEGHHSADLLMAANPAQLRHLQPLYRWIKDQNQIARLSVLTGIERKAVNDILFRLKQSSVKLIQTSSGKPVQHMEPGCFDYVLPHDSGVGGQTRTTRSITWICLPYFSLEPYSGLLSGAENSSAFPIQTLLQAQFSRTAKERDMQQAVRQVAKAGPGLLFVITYGRMSEDVLCGNSITKSVKSLSSLSEEQSQQKLWVRFGGNVMWTLAVKDCQTWFGFVSHFWEFWHLPLCFYRNKRVVCPEDWPKIWASASQKHSHTISFDLELGPTPKLPTPGRLVPIQPQSEQTEGTATDEPKDSEATNSKKESRDEKARRTTHLRPPTTRTTTANSPKASEPPPSSSFALFTCLDDVSLANKDTIDEAKLDERLHEIETILLHETSVSDQRAYKRCPSANRLSIYHMLEHEEQEIVHPETRIRSSNPQDYEIRADIFNLADMIFSQGLNAIVKDMAKKPLLEKSVVLPQELVSLMSMKLLTDVTPGLPNISQTYSTYLSAIESNITGKQSDRSHEQRLDLLDQELLVVQKTVRSQRDIFERLERDSQQSAYKMPVSARSRVAPIRGPPERAYYSGAPRGARSAPNIYRQYNHYEQPYLRSAHGYGQQGQGQYYEPPPFYVEEVPDSMTEESKQLSARDPGGFRQLFLNECILQLDQREREFEEYELHSKQLRVMNRNKVDIKKDRQERLIYAFTVVTIIFLPLSAVSSIFGMNTSDIRDMEVGQWAYWAVAIPVTAAVLFLGFLFTGDLGAVFRWVSRISGSGMSSFPGSGFQGKLPSLGSGTEKWRIEKPGKMALGSGPDENEYGERVREREIEDVMPRRSENLRRRSYTPYETGEYSGAYSRYGRGEVTGHGQRAGEKWGLPY
ncbi:hypothetical protein N0V85_007144 [Neurospora sp. IMI 360204]|nr:hypothetical protein N0V85_007144 [Neurospora sp. IMI 360204]